MYNVHACVHMYMYVTMEMERINTHKNRAKDVDVNHLARLLAHHKVKDMSLLRLQGTQFAFLTFLTFYAQQTWHSFNQLPVLPRLQLAHRGDRYTETQHPESVSFLCGLTSSRTDGQHSGKCVKGVLGMNQTGAERCTGVHICNYICTEAW